MTKTGIPVMLHSILHFVGKREKKKNMYEDY